MQKRRRKNRETERKKENTFRQGFVCKDRLVNCVAQHTEATKHKPWILAFYKYTICILRLSHISETGKEPIVNTNVITAYSDITSKINIFLLVNKVNPCDHNESVCGKCLPSRKFSI